VQGVDFSVLPAMSPACQKEAVDYHSLMTRFLATHIVTLIACLSREIYSAETDLFGQFMRIIEIVCIPMYLSSIFSALQHLSVIMVREADLINDDLLASVTREDITSANKND